jgi:transcriptional regulator with XRE-family HTH domain
MPAATLILNPDELRRLRLLRALTQEDLSDLSGIQSSTICRLETGARRARLSTIRALATALEVAPDAIADLR